MRHPQPTSQGGTAPGELATFEPKLTARATLALSPLADWVSREAALRRVLRQPETAGAQDQRHDGRHDEPGQRQIPRHRNLPSTARATICSATPSPTQASVASACRPP
jgi:hypothetical protein